MVPEDVIDLVMAYTPARWIPYHRLFLASAAFRRQPDRCRHCWQPLVPEDANRPVRPLTCGHIIHVDCAHRRARHARHHGCPRCNQPCGMTSRAHDPLPLHVLPPSFWAAATPMLEHMHWSQRSMVVRPCPRLPPRITRGQFYALAQYPAAHLIAFGPFSSVNSTNTALWVRNTYGTYYGHRFKLTSYEDRYFCIRIALYIKYT